MAQAVPGKTWLEVKLDIVEGAARFDDELRQLCVENLIRGLVYLERAGMVHGDLSPNNVIVNLDAKRGDPALYLIDFDGFFADSAGKLAHLSIGEGGTFGTRGYCPPELEQRSQQSDLTVAPFSDRYGRDMLLVELLCFDKECDFEDPASEWSTEKIQRRLSQSAAGEHLRHLAAEDVFQLPEDRRPTSYDLARNLRMATPPRLKRRGGTLTRAWQRTSGGPGIRWGQWVPCEGRDCLVGLVRGALGADQFLRGGMAAVSASSSHRRADSRRPHCHWPPVDSSGWACSWWVPWGSRFWHSPRINLA